MNSGKNHQSIGCEVTSCRFNKQGCDCELEHIEVRPSCDCHSGDCNEANCGSYTAKCPNPERRGRHSAFPSFCENSLWDC